MNKFSTIFNLNNWFKAGTAALIMSIVPTVTFSNVIKKSSHDEKKMALDTCSPISTLSCSDITVGLPFTLSFDAPVTNTIIDKNGAGTGFRTVNTYSGTRLTVDGQPTNTAVPGYEPSKINLTGGRLQITTNKGIDYLTNNNQINVLGVKLAPASKLQFELDVINPYNGTQSQQAGLWFGLNDKTFIKLAITGNKVELRKELNDVSSTAAPASNPDQRITAVISNLNTKTVRLRLVIDSVVNTAEGFYSVDGGSTYVSTGTSYASPAVNIGGMGITNGIVYAGITTTYRNASAAVTYTFDNFSAQSIYVPIVNTFNINFQPSTTTIPAGYVADTGLPYNLTRGYGWADFTTKQPIDNQENMRLRSGTGDIKQLTLVQMQTSAIWEYAVANGSYRVSVSAGDNAYYDSGHQINVEGLPVISDFVPSSSNKFKLSTGVVQVNDGKLTIDVTGGTNTKMNYVTFAPVTPVSDVISPKVSARLVGTLKSAGNYDDQVQVFLTASDEGGSGLASFQYSVNNGVYTDYKTPFTLGTAGAYSITVKAVDGNNNQTISAPYNFNVVAQPTTGAYMVLKNMDNFPSNDRLVFSLIQTPWRRTSPDTTPYNANHDKVRLRINSKGTGKLIVSNLTLSNPAAWKIVSVNSDTTSKVPFSVATNTFTDITIAFIAKNAATRLKVFTDTLSIKSNDSLFATKKVILSGIWQAVGESTNEPYAQQIINAFGFGSVVGYGQNDGNVDGTTRITGSSEINANYFVKADLSKPVTVHQLAAYHGCCSAVESIRYFKKGSTSSTNIFTHNNLDGQSISPRLIGSSTNLAQATFDPTGVIGFKVGSSSSDRTMNFNGLIGIRVLKAYDGNGNIIPNAYFLNCDYLGTSYTNYDYQDNIYYVENIRPDSSAAYYSELAPLGGTAINFNPTLTGATTTVNLTVKNMGNSYANNTADPSIQLKGAQIVGPNANEFSLGSFTNTVLAIQATKSVNVKFNPSSVGIKNAALIINYNSAASPLRIPLYGNANNSTATVNVIKRIKGAADVNVTIGNNAYEADKNYRKGSIKLDKQTILSDVAGTDIDSLYQTYLSAAAELAETRYEIPVTNGDYLVRMHFVENYWTGAGQRVFSATMENVQILSNFDIFSEVGYRTALVKDFSTTVSDGVLNIKFNPTANRVAISAIEIFQVNQNTSLTRMSSTLAATPDPSTVIKLSIYPNPNLGETFNLKLDNFPKNEKVVVSIVNAFGKLIKTQSLDTDPLGHADLPIVMGKALERGVYIINARSASGVQMTSKLLVP